MMLCLQSVLRKHSLIDDIIGLIGEYLDIESLGNWRATHKQAFYEVEMLVRKKVFLLEQTSCQQFIQEPTGFLLGSAWFQFRVNVYKCKQCHRYESCTPCQHSIMQVECTEAEELGLCTDCFIDNTDVICCFYCHIYTSNTNSARCYNCHSHVCLDCDDLIAPCFGCDEVFCDQCRLGNYCLNCQ